MPINGKRILITGGAGFIGSALLPHLVEGNEIVVYDTFQRDAISAGGLADHSSVSVLEGDVTDEDAVKSAMDGCDVVIHLAAVAGIDTVVVSPTRTMRVNILGTANVLQSALEHGCERIVCFSTSEVFGRQAFRSEETDRTEIGAVGEARWTYAVGKLAGEHLAHSYFAEFGLPTVVIRPFNVYGPGQIGEGALRLFVERAIRDETIEIHGDGTQIRAWCYIDDIVRAVLTSLDSERAIGESFNVGNARAVVTVYGLANAVVRITGSASRIVFTRSNYADVELRVPNVDKAREILGFEAAVDLEEGIRRTAAWYRERLAEPQVSQPSSS